MTQNLPTLAIIGRQTVGKSTLFNRLVGKRLALVDDQPGVTRDRRYANGSLADLRFRLVDTAGMEEAAPDALATRMFDQTKAAMNGIEGVADLQVEQQVLVPQLHIAINREAAARVITSRLVGHFGHTGG